MNNRILDRVETAAKEYDKWPESFKNAFRLSTIVDRIPPSLQEGIALLAEVDRLKGELIEARRCDCAPCQQVDAARADGYREGMVAAAGICKSHVLVTATRDEARSQSQGIAMAHDCAAAILAAASESLPPAAPTKLPSNGVHLALTVSNWIKERFPEQFIPASVVNAAEELADMAAASDHVKVPETCEWVHVRFSLYTPKCRGWIDPMPSDAKFCPFCGKTITVREG